MRDLGQGNPMSPRLSKACEFANSLVEASVHTRALNTEERYSELTEFFRRRVL
jgi:hypothetical protein